MEAAIDASIAPLTLRRYASAWGKYSAWCKDLGKEPLPVTEDKALAYVALLAKQGMKKGTVKYHLAGLRMAQIKAGMRAPDWSEMDRLTQLKKGLARLEAVGGNRGHAREPVREIHMRAMLDVWTSKGQRGTMLWAAACMCFFGCLRAGEALAPESGVFDRGAYLSWEDVQLDSDRSSRWIRVRIKESKTDRLREGAWVTLHRTDTALCPVKAVLRFMVDEERVRDPSSRTVMALVSPGGTSWPKSGGHWSRRDYPRRTFRATASALAPLRRRRRGEPRRTMLKLWAGGGVGNTGDTFGTKEGNRPPRQRNGLRGSGRRRAAGPSRPIDIVCYCSTIFVVFIAIDSLF